MVDEGKAHEDEDKERREQIETRNRADQLCYEVEKTLEETKDKLPADKVSDIEGKLKNLRAAIERDERRPSSRAWRRSRRAMHELAQVAYQARRSARRRRAPGGAAPGAGKAKKDDGVIDAEFEDN